MRFSILIPVYNSEKYLEQCIDSALTQTFDDYEIIAVNDGSTDSSLEILKQYASSNSRLHIISKENGGLISARRTGIASANGEYCVFLDADDWLEQNALEEIDASIKKSGADIVIYRLIKHRPDGTIYLPALFEDGQIFEKDDKKKIYLRLINDSSLNSLCMKSIKTHLLRSDPTDYTLTRNPNGEDKYQSLYPYTYAEKIVYLDRSLYHCRVSGESITRQVSLSGAKDLFNNYAINNLRKSMKLWNMEQPEHIEGFYVMLLIKVIDYFSQCFALANNEKERRKVFDYNWFSLLPEGFEPYLSSARLTKSKRMRLGWLYKKQFIPMRFAYMLAGRRALKRFK